MAKKILEIKDLELSFKIYSGKVQAIRGIDISVNEGEIMALVGESGSGKSVTAKSIIGLLPANKKIEQGSIVVNGLDITNYQEKDFQKIRGSEVGMIFQDPMTALNPVLTVGYQILEAFLIHHDIDKKEGKKRVIELLDQVGINNSTSVYEQYPFQLSGGMRQRIVIAITLACEPKLLIADEPTTALDVTIQAQILDLLKSLQNKLGFAILFITHDLGVVAKMADQVSVMYAGKIVERGLVNEIFYNPKHPYTWGLLSSMPDLDVDDEKELISIPGSAPNMMNPPKGDAFAPRNKYALKIDFEKEPPMFRISDTHFASTWLLHEDAPKIEVPKIIQRRVEISKKHRNV